MGYTFKVTRKITVEGEHYRWAVKDQGDGLILLVKPIAKLSTPLTCSFSIRTAADTETQYGSITPSNGTERLFIITPHVVRQVIVHALQKGWTPAVNGPAVSLYNLDPQDFLKLKLRQ